MARRAMCSGFATRLASSALAWALCVSGAYGEPPVQPTVRLVVQSSPLAGFRHHEAPELWSALRVGDPLELERERDNPHDANAVSVAWRGHKLGYVPRRENAVLAWSLDRGERLRARISRLAAHPNPARRIEFEVYAQ
jgi:HIRAN domain-containing protein